MGKGMREGIGERDEGGDCGERDEGGDYGEKG